MSLIAGQFGHPRGLLGRFIGRGMVRSNGDFNRWFVGEIGRRCGHYPARIAELGPGPGVGHGTSRGRRGGQHASPAGGRRAGG